MSLKNYVLKKELDVKFWRNFKMISFQQRKKDILFKKDKSSKGKWDERIISLCNKINSFNEYYTTSSCSGKCVILEDKIGKDGSYYLWESHEKISFENLKHDFGKIKNKKLLKFKFQSPILFVACENIEFAKILLNKSRNVGFKDSGIFISNKLIGVEIKSGEKIEFPLMDNNILLVENLFLKKLIKIVNNKFDSVWNKLKRLEGFL